MISYDFSFFAQQLAFSRCPNRGVEKTQTTGSTLHIFHEFVAGLPHVAFSISNVFRCMAFDIFKFSLWSDVPKQDIVSNSCLGWDERQPFRCRENQNLFAK